MKKKEGYKLLKEMLLIRKFEERLLDLFKDKKIRGTLHSSIGQEAISVGSCYSLGKEDIVTASHRSHHIMISKGLKIDKLIAEMMGREEGYCRGLAGSMHIFSKEHNFFGSNGIVSANIALSAGMALAIKRKNEKKLVVTFFGEGATTEGIFHETLNMASLMNLPIIFACENNLYAQSTELKEQTKIIDLSEKIKSAYGIDSIKVDGNNLLEVLSSFKKITSYVRKNKKPFFIELLTYRLCGHSINDNEQNYRKKEELKIWLKKDPIVRLKKDFLERGIFTKTQIVEIELEIEKELNKAISFATNSKEPDLNNIGDRK